MLYIHLAAAFGLILFALCFLLRNKEKITDSGSIMLLFTLAFFLRLTAAGSFRGFDNDTACFAAWADRIFQVGPASFYADTVFTDYPPGYIYLLYPIGALRALFCIEYGSTAHLVLLKLPAILCDLGCGLLLYREVARRLSQFRALLFAAAYLFNPALLLNSSVWGQVDSVYTLLLTVMCLSLLKGSLFPAFLSFLSGILIKPQMLLFAPILFIGILRQVFLQDFSFKKLWLNLAYGFLSLTVLLLLILPFGPGNVVSQYFDTLGSYPYAAVNACNFWGMLGLNWVSQDNTFLGLPYRFYGGAAIAAAVILVLYLGLGRRGSSASRKEAETAPSLNYPLLSALLMASVFVFSVRMHERYLYPAIVMMLLSCVCLPSKRLYLCYCALSLLHFYNTAHVLFFYDPGAYNRKDPLIILVSAGTVLFLILLWKWIPKLSRGLSPSEQDFLYSPVSVALPPSSSRPPSRLKKADYACLLLITFFYSCFALYDLGDRQAPSTSLDLKKGESILLEFDLAPEQEIKAIAYYIAPPHRQFFTLTEGDSQVILQNVFTWQMTALAPDLSASGQIGLTLESDSASLLELVFLDEAGKALVPVNSEEYPALFDEQSLYPGESSFRDSMYFDEIYHARTAYEFLKELPAYENTHPPLGKLFIAAGVAVFGMTPFGWRIAGTLFGIAMIPLVYLFARRLTGNMPLAALGCLLFSFDFMHFTQTRLATIDVYITFFVILMYYFMYRYTQLSFYDTPLRKTFLPLGACGVCMGLGIACKWTGVYAGIGLALIFFGTVFRRYREYCYAKENPRGSTESISHSAVVNSFLPNILRTFLFCLLFFVAVPALLYLLSYLPFSDGTNDNLFVRMLHNQEYMFRYHSGLNSSHPYSSPWYQWPVMYRPIWYYSRIVTGSPGAGGLREGISAFGNPLVWWPGIPAALYVLYRSLAGDKPRKNRSAAIPGAQKKDSTAAFLLTGYLAQYLPWFFVTRVTFIYHYFPSVVFVVLMILFSLSKLRHRMKRKTFTALLFLYGASSFGLFLLYYPVLSGQPVASAFVDRFLRWFPSWVLTAD